MTRVLVGLWAAVVCACLVVLAVRGNRAPTEPHKYGSVQPTPQVPQPVVPVDNATGLNGNVMFVPGNPGYVAISNTASDGGASAPAPGDPTAGDLLNSRYVQNTTSTGGVIYDAGTHNLVAGRFYNAGTLSAVGQVYCGQCALDAGGTSDAGTTPSVQLACPAGTPCDWQMPSTTTCGPCASWYSSSTIGLLTVDAGQQAMTSEWVYR